jgi:hypothetical protein
MKKTCILFVLLITSISIFAQNQAVDRFIAKYEDNDNFTSVFVSPKMFDMVSKVAGEEADGELKEILKDIKGLKILSTKINPGVFYKEAAENLGFEKYDLLMKVREKDQNVKIFTKEATGIINELILLVGGDEEFTLLSFVGKIDLEKIGRLAGKLNIEGAEHLKNLDKSNK